MIARIFASAPAADTTPRRNSFHAWIFRHTASEKLGIKDGYRVLFVKLPPDVETELRSALAGCEIIPKAATPVDFAMVFTRSKTELNAEFKRLSKMLAPAGMLWVSWPKKSSGVTADLDENVVREIGLAAGLVDMKVCAVSEVWSGLKFVRRLKDR
jgi:hypothetical protein